MNEIILCDVCARIIEGPICEHCGFVNVDQFDDWTIHNAVRIFIDECDIYDDDILMRTIVEIFGLDEEEIQSIITDKENIGDGYHE